MSDTVNRRHFLASASAIAIASTIPRAWGADDPPKLPFKISLAEWSLNKALFGKKLDNLDFAKTAKNDFGIEAVEYVDQFFKDKAQDEKYLKELKQRAEDNGVKSVLIMIDTAGNLGEPDSSKRAKAVENHHQWVDAAKFLGCHAIRVNARSQGSPEEQRKYAGDGLRQLAEYGKKLDMNVIVENHGGLSSNGEWLASVMKDVGMPNCGTLPDFGNFGDYDRYKGVAELMPFAKGVSAKSHDFDDQGNETKTDYRKMMKIVLDAGYHGHVGVEYEGSRLSEPDGIKATKRLLERVGAELATKA
jgi:L-ribulose-5-phosphate 3-epimerase